MNSRGLGTAKALLRRVLFLPAAALEKAREGLRGGTSFAYEALEDDGPERPLDDDSLLPWIFPTKEQQRHFRLLVLLCCCRTVADAVIGNEAGKFNANLTRALESKDAERFCYSLPYVVIFSVVRTAMGLLPKYTVFKLSAMLKLGSVNALTQALYSNKEAVARPFYRLQFVEGGKTPEFQIIQDSMEFADRVVAFVETAANVLTAPLFFQEALEQDASRFFFLFGLTIVSISLQVVSYATIFGNINWLVWEKVNNVRSVLTRVLSNVEAIALFRGGDAEMLRVRSVHSMVAGVRQVLARRAAIHATVFLFQNLAFALWPAMTIMQELLDGRTKFADIQRFVDVTVGSISRLAGLASLPGQINGMLVSRTRILHILKEAERIHEEAAQLKEVTTAGRRSEDFIITYEHDKQDRDLALELRDVALRTPPVQQTPGQLLMQGLSLRMTVGESLLIVGDSGVGKSALLFAISGIWSAGSGQISRCHRSGVVCLPQRPFTFLGSLREQLLYPNVDDTLTSDDELWGVLATLNLERHLRNHGLDKICSWADVLSPGQQQRISVARALLAAGRVRLMLLDEATSALDLNNERTVYEALLQCRPHCLVSVGHRPSVRRYHKRMLTLTAQESEDAGCFTHHVVSTLPPAPPAARASSSAAEAGQPTEAPSPAPPKPQEAKPADPQLRWLPEPYATVVDCFNAIWTPLSAQVPEVMQDSKKGGVKAVFVAVVIGSFAFKSQRLGMDFVEAMTQRNQETAYSMFRWLTLLGLVPMVMGPVGLYNFMSVYQSTAERLRLFLLERFLGGPDAAYYSMRLQGGLNDDNPADILTGMDCDLVVLTWLFVLGFTSGVMGILTSMARLLIWSPRLALGLLAPVLLIGVPLTVKSMQSTLGHWMKSTGLRAAICARVAHARENAEAVALLDGGPAERKQLDRMAAKFIDANQSIVLVQMHVGMVISLLTSTIQTINTFVSGTSVVSGHRKLSEYYDTALMIGLAFSIIGAAGQLCGQNVMPNFVSCGRVRDLMSRINSAKMAVNNAGILLEEHPDEKIVLELRCVALSLMQNAKSKELQQQLLLTRVSARLWEGESLLIVGESGLGKSSLLRAIAGVCTTGSGQIYCPRREHVMFFAQRPYLCFGTLREQLLYPNVGRHADERQLREALKAVDLEHLLESPGLGPRCTTAEETEKALHESQRWTSQLSLGEIQRLGFARLLLREGIRLTLFDEGTSALDLTREATLYSLLSGHTRSYVSVAHRPQLYQWHSHVLVLDQNTQGQALGISRFSDMAHFRQELEGLGSHRSEKTGLRKQLVSSERARP